MNLGKDIAKDFLFYLLEISDAAKEAKRKGLKYGGFGRWKDKSGKTVAKTEDGKLVPWKGGDENEAPTPSSSTKKPEDDEKKTKMTLVGVYSGRFQPFGRHHFAAYKQLQAVTGANTYIATSNVTDNKKSPFTFEEKKRIIQKYGIPGNRIVRTKSPYNPEEIMSKYDPKTTAMVVIFGAKDADARLSKGKYYRPFSNSKQLEGYRDAGYFIVAKHESVVVGGKELSGTQIRKFLGSHKIDPEQKKKLFKAIFGWYDPSLFDMITKKVGDIIPKDESVLSSKPLLTEGGAYGHMMHPFDDNKLTFGDFKSIVLLALQGHLDKEAQVQEKLDGQTLSISWVNGKVVAARNKGQLKNGGAAAPDIDGIKKMFAGRGIIQKAFSLAVEDLQSAINGLTEKQKQYIFDNGKNFMNLEIIYPKTQNVLPYEQSLVVFHGLITYDNNGNAIGENKGAARILAGMIRQVNANVQKTFEIKSHGAISIPAHQDFSAKSKYFISKIDALKNKLKMKDSDTLALYHQTWWENFITKKANGMGYSIPNSVLTSLTKRWAFNDTSNKILDIVKSISNPKFAEWVRDFDKNNHEQQMKENMLPFEKLFLELGAEVLSNASGFLAANPDKTVQSIRNKLDATVKQLRGSSDLNLLKKLEMEMGRIQAIGGFDKIVPSEGIVFTYKGKTYKLTGAFAPINKILGIVTYSK